MSKLDQSLETIQNALMGYCEDCISSDKAEQRAIDTAFRLVSEAIQGETEKTEPGGELTTIPVCAECKSEKVWSDAVAFFNTASREWDIAEANEVHFGCTACGFDDVKVEWIEPQPEQTGKYSVDIRHTDVFTIEVEADSEEAAEDKAGELLAASDDKFEEYYACTEEDRAVTVVRV